MTIAKSIKSASGKTIVFRKDENGKNVVSVFEPHAREPMTEIEAGTQQQSLALAAKLAMT
jgi:hypothetical protein